MNQRKRQEEGKTDKPIKRKDRSRDSSRLKAWPGSLWRGSPQPGSLRCSGAAEERSRSPVWDPLHSFAAVLTSSLLFVHLVSSQVTSDVPDVLTGILSEVGIREAGRQVSRQMAKTDRQSSLGIRLTWESNCVWESRENRKGKKKEKSYSNESSVT